ncbi:hypothetical protein BDV12DRAFT_95259 [Aspergillus spectabilis]
MRVAGKSKQRAGKWFKVLPDIALSVRSCGFYCNWQSAKDALARADSTFGRRLLTRFSLGCVGIPRPSGFLLLPLCTLQLLSPF